MAKQQYISGSIGPSVQVEGLEEAIQMLDELPRFVVLAGFTGAFQAAARVFRDELQLQVPVRSETLWNPETFAEMKGAEVGGALRAALMHEVTLDSRYRGGRVEVGFGKLGYIANFLEYGHRMTTHGGRAVSGPRTPGGWVAANPFMRRSFEAGKERAIDAFVNSIAETIRRFKIERGMAA